MNRIKVAAGIILRQLPNQKQQVLIAKRPHDKHQGGLWEFPGGKVEPKETSEQALSRELLEEINISVLKSEFFQQIDFDYFDKKVSLSFYSISEFSGEPKGLEGQETQWVFVDDLERYDFPPANQEVVAKLQEKS